MKFKQIIFLTLFFLSNTISLLAQKPITAKLTLNDSSMAESVVLPQFPGGETAFYNFLSENITYPHILIKTEMEGSVELCFVINKEGKAQNIEITRGFDPLADDEVVRVLEAMPQWAPATAKGETTDIKQKLTVSFKLNEELIKKVKEASKHTEQQTGKSTEAEKENKPEIEESTNLKQEKTQNTDPIAKVDTLLNREPQFPGGKDALEAYLKKHMKYPKRAIEYKIEGRAVFSIVVSAEGEISKIMIYKGLCRDCDEEAYYLIKKMPNWIPGLKDGKPVSMQVMLPIPFNLPK